MFKKLIIANIINKPFKWLEGVWNYFNGKKTAIAGSLALAAIIIHGIDIDVFVNIWHRPEMPHLQQIVDTLNWIAIRLGGVGIVHKAVKSQIAIALNTPAPTAKGLGEQPTDRKS